MGFSTLGLPIPMGRFGRQEGRCVLLIGGVHGDEPTSTEAILSLVAQWVVDLPVDLPRILVVPALNPDGLLAGTKNSARDVDLNRNWPSRNFTTEHRPGYDPGPEALSEPESRALAELIERESPAAVVAVHAPFACINPDGPAAAWADKVSAACGWPAVADLGYPTPGSLGSWLGVDRGLPMLTIEFPPGPLAGFSRQAQLCLAAAVSFAPIAGAVPYG
jgi:murein peptide amidase A